MKIHLLISFVSFCEKPGSLAHFRKLFHLCNFIKKMKIFFKLNNNCKIPLKKEHTHKFVNFYVYLFFFSNLLKIFKPYIISEQTLQKWPIFIKLNKLEKKQNNNLITKIFVILTKFVLLFEPQERGFLLGQVYYKNKNQYILIFFIIFFILPEVLVILIILFYSLKIKYYFLFFLVLIELNLLLFFFVISFWIRLINVFIDSELNIKKIKKKKKIIGLLIDLKYNKTIFNKEQYCKLLNKLFFLELFQKSLKLESTKIWVKYFYFIFYGLIFILLFSNKI